MPSRSSRSSARKAATWVSGLPLISSVSSDADAWLIAQPRPVKPIRSRTPSRTPSWSVIRSPHRGFDPSIEADGSGRSYERPERQPRQEPASSHRQPTTSSPGPGPRTSKSCQILVWRTLGIVTGADRPLTAARIAHRGIPDSRFRLTAQAIAGKVALERCPTFMWRESGRVSGPEPGRASVLPFIVRRPVGRRGGRPRAHRCPRGSSRR